MCYQNIKKSNSMGGDRTPDVESLGQQKIVMLTDIIENDESKCAIYFPQLVGTITCSLSQYGRRHKDCEAILERIEKHFEQDDVWPVGIPTRKILSLDRDRLPDIDFSYFCVKNVGIFNRKGYTIRKFHCIYHSIKRPSSMPSEPNESKAYQFIVYHYWFPHWPDHRSPENIDVVLDMCIDILDSDCDVYFQPDDGKGDQTTIKTTHSNEWNKPMSVRPIPIIHW